MNYGLWYMKYFYLLVNGFLITRSCAVAACFYISCARLGGHTTHACKPQLTQKILDYIMVVQYHHNSRHVREMAINHRKAPWKLRLQSKLREKLQMKNVKEKCKPFRKEKEYSKCYTNRLSFRIFKLSLRISLENQFSM